MTEENSMSADHMASRSRPPASSKMIKDLDSISHTSTMRILDMGCGEGRNAFTFAKIGHHVTAADIDHERLRSLQATAGGINARNISCVAVDFLSKEWPFRQRIFDLIVSVHFPHYLALTYAHHYIKSGGYLYFDSVGCQGQNFLQLPEKGWFREKLSHHYDFVRYEERPAGPHNRNIVAVRLLAQRNA